MRSPHAERQIRFTQPERVTDEEKIAGCEQLVDTSEAEEDGIDLVLLKILFHPRRMLNEAIRDSVAV